MNAKIEKHLIQIARENIIALEEREDLETSGSDDLDFIEVSVWEIRSALRAAYELGRAQGAAEADTEEARAETLWEIFGALTKGSISRAAAEAAGLKTADIPATVRDAAENPEELTGAFAAEYCGEWYLLIPRPAGGFLALRPAELFDPDDDGALAVSTPAAEWLESLERGR